MEQIRSSKHLSPNTRHDTTTCTELKVANKRPPVFSKVRMGFIVKMRGKPPRRQSSTAGDEARVRRRNRGFCNLYKRSAGIAGDKTTGHRLISITYIIGSCPYVDPPWHANRHCMGWVHALLESGLRNHCIPVGTATWGHQSSASGFREGPAEITVEDDSVLLIAN